MTMGGDVVARRGMLFIISSPSGAGKTSISRALLGRSDDLTISVSVTTRSPRAGEVEGGDYFFVDEDKFKALRAAGEFLEWAEVYDHFYGTLREPVLKELDAGRDVLFDIDWQGAKQLREALPDSVVSVFVLPPSIATLEARLTSRNQDSREIVANRMKAAVEQIDRWADYDYVIVNSDLESSTRSVQAILEAERKRRVRQSGLADFVGKLQTQT